MAHKLYQLAKLAARRPWAFIVSWAVIIGLLVGSAALFMGKLTNDFAIPGTETQDTLDEVEKIFPEFSGGTGSVVFTTANGNEFTDEQKQEISSMLAGLEEDKTALVAADPFKNQAEIANAGNKIEEGKKELAANEKKLADGQKQLDGAKKKISDGQKQLDDGKKQLEAGLKQAQDGAKQLEAAGMTQTQQYMQAKGTIQALEQQQAGLKAKQAELDEGRAELETKQKEIDEGKKKLEEGRAELAQGQRQAESTEGMKFVSDNGASAVAHMQFEGQAEAMETQKREHLLSELHSVESLGIEVYPSTEISSDLNSVFGIGEAIGLVVAGLVLFIMMGTFVGAGLPLVQAVLGVGAGVAGTLAFSSVVDMASITPALALMLGLAVGIDYTLFIVHRHRRQLMQGVDVKESIGLAVGTSGSAVVFAGLTVVIALVALLVPGLPFLSVLGLSAAATVALAVLIAVTLTPALLSLIGQRLVSKRAQKAFDAKQAKQRARLAGAEAGTGAEADDGAGADAETDGDADRGGHNGWTRFTTGKPWLAALAGVLLLGVIAIPSLKLTTALPDGASEPYGSDAQVAYEKTAEDFGAGFNGPILGFVTLPEGASEAEAQKALYETATKVREIEGVIAASPVEQTDDNRYGLLQIIPTTGPADDKTVDLVETIRAAEHQFEDETGAKLALTGQVTAMIDVSEKMAEALPPYLVIVVSLSLVLLLLVFRSIVVPLIATLGFLLSLAAAFGATVAVYQFGWLGELFGVHTPGPIMSFLPILLTGILFGLAMDYQMFLVTAMREAFVHGASPRAAVRKGMTAAAPVVVAAALIMISVFAGFIFSELSMIRPIGFALAFGVLFDAFVVRLTITPAIMTLLGKHAWFIPGWLDKALPNVDVEGESLSEEIAAAERTATESKDTDTADKNAARA
ncbi:MMPL family transporter [Pseudoglutamicibacter albus]|uniref:MMPL family transporter n=1 Tax=Pseudoglutamicibacter albus TaxID=98671 RepID=UPI001EF4C79E|nr:MMPL family transporter [Pseudoglutamicibacter albus]MCG7305280.1 MMPL family transporter [Pseudoglutamicibacter albus]